MISVLIPVYNFSVAELVSSLQVQLQILDHAWEIRCYDDGSSAFYRIQNKPIADLNGVIYQELPTNIGRSAIRNLLARDAIYEYCLFLDNDSGVVKDDFMACYLSHLPNPGLLYGGRIYEDQKPEKQEYLLHWTYGSLRESQKVQVRAKEPYHSFMSNNFCVPTVVINNIGFDEQIAQYGHEDTLWGLELQSRGIAITHLDNPIVHLGLETADEFLEKQIRAIQNLGIIREKYPEFSTKLLMTNDLLSKCRLRGLCHICLKIILPYIEKNLNGPNPSMRALDLWKLYQLLEHS